MKFSKKQQYFSFKKSYKNSNHIIAGLDLSMRHTGIVIINGMGQVIYKESIVSDVKKKNKSRPQDIHEIYFKVNDEYIEHSEVISKDGELDHLKRIILIEQRIEKILKQFKVTQVGIEGYAFAKGRAGMVFQIGELGGLVKTMLRKNNYPFTIIPPTSLKSYIAGNGHAQKEEIQAAVLRRFGLSFDDDNEADAFGLAQLVLDLGEETKMFCMAGGPAAYRRDLEGFESGSTKKKI